MSKITQKEFDQMHAQYARIEAYDQWAWALSNVTENAMPVDKDYQFRPNTASFKIGRFLVRSLARILLPVLNKILFDLKIDGKDNIKKVDSAIRVSNHVMPLDTLVNFQLAFGHRHYMTGAEFNLKKGIGGKFFRAGGFLPLASSIKAMSNLDKEISTIFQEGNSIVTFYAEQAIWKQYKNSRPLKKGAFHYASKNDVPVVMTVILFRKPNCIRRMFGFKKDCTVKVCPAIYPKKELSVKENITYLQESTQEAYDRAVCEFYGYDYEKYDMRLTPLENKLVAQGLIDKEETLLTKPNDSALLQKLMPELSQRQIDKKVDFY